jgi:hypothetical protein
MMKRVLLLSILIILLSSISMAQTYTEIFNGGWGRATSSCKPAFIDLDNDGLLDLLVGEYLGNLTHYEQEEMNSRNFTRISEIFHELEIGKSTAPSFIDLDKDGLLDMIVGNQGGYLHHYKQDAIHSTSFTLVSESFNEIKVDGRATPAFIDLDNNGLLDMLVGQQNGTINHYQQDTLNSTSFTLISDSLCGIDIGKWSVPTFVDLDDDGLLDMFIGENSGSIFHYEQDVSGSFSFVLISEKFNGIQLNNHAAPVFIDLDKNGLLDMIVGDMDGFLHHFEQNATGSENFNLITDKLITGVIDVGSSAVPCFADLDNDGLLDIIVGEYNGYLNHYEQDANGSDIFNLLSDDFNGIRAGIYSSPIITNFENNNLMDLVIGNFDGKILYYEQNAEGSNDFILVSNEFNGIDVGKSAEPAFIDLDNDDLLDMIVGEDDGNLNHYEQDAIGSTTFALITDSLSGINIQRWIRPCFTDLDEDGLLDMIIGEYDGNLNHYEQNSTGSSNFALVTENFKEIQVGEKSRPTFVDINSDGLEDLLVGDGDGGIHYFKRDKGTFVEDNLNSDSNPYSFKVFPNYPNPFNPVTTIQYYLPKSVNVHISIYNSLGQMLRIIENSYQHAGSHKVKWDGRDNQNISLSSGVYICHLQLGSIKESIKLLLLK